MNVLDLAHELGMSPKRSGQTNGGEYKSMCPKCGEGTDRFCIWPKQGESGRYWCRVCDTKGDAIQFCRDFLGLTFQQACLKLQVVRQEKDSAYVRSFRQEKFIPHAALPVHVSWQQTAKNFIASSHENLLKHPKIIEDLGKRGLIPSSIERFSLGWNEDDLFQDRKAWGLFQEIKGEGHPKRQWLPKGIVIPSFFCNHPIKIKIRRSDWLDGDVLPKYVEIPGSKQAPSIYGDISKPVIIVESELDAMLIQQEAFQQVCCVALGGVSKKPDIEMHAWLQQVPLILLSLDFDAAGKNKYTSWLKIYKNLHPWPAPMGKSPGDAYSLYGINLSKWIEDGLKN